MAQAVSADSRPSPPEKLQGRLENHGLWLLRRIWDRVNRDNQHFMGVLVGEEGSGKSFTAMKIASEVDPTFTADRVIFNIKDLLEILRDGEHEPGNFYVLDEAGVQLGRRTWQEREQILANQALQIIRDHNLGLIFTLPRLSELDSQTQGRLQAFFEIIKKEEGEYVEGKLKFFDPDRADDTGIIYKKFPRRRVDGEVLRITRFYFSPPPDDLVEPYLDRKTAFQNEIYEKTIQQLEDDESDNEEQTVQELAAQIVNNGIERYVNKHNQTGEPYIDEHLIRAEHDLTQSDSKAIRSLLKKQFDRDALQELVA